MIKYFNSEYLSRYLVLLLFASCCWLPSFLMPAPTEIGLQPLYQLYFWLIPDYFYLQHSMAFVVTLATALMANNLLKAYGFSGKITTLGIFVTLLLQCDIPAQLGMSPFLWINVLFIFLFGNLYSIPSNNNNNITTANNAGLLIGTASLLYSPLLFLLPLIWYALMTHRSASWRNFTATMVGFLLPLIFAITWYYWSGNLEVAYGQWLSGLHADLHFQLPENFMEMGIVAAVILLIAASALHTFAHLNEKNINLRHNLSLTLFALVNISIILLFYHQNLIAGMILIIPSSIILSQFLLQIRSLKWYNISLIALAFLIVVNHYIQLLYA